MSDPDVQLLETWKRETNCAIPFQDWKAQRTRQTRQARPTRPGRNAQPGSVSVTYLSNVLGAYEAASWTHRGGETEQRVLFRIITKMMSVRKSPVDYSQSDLARDLSIARRPTITATLARLEHAGWLRRHKGKRTQHEDGTWEREADAYTVHVPSDRTSVRPAETHVNAERNGV
jgi:hypothetical protein